jgi:hypothetical protein
VGVTWTHRRSSPRAPPPPPQREPPTRRHRQLQAAACESWRWQPSRARPSSCTTGGLSLRTELDRGPTRLRQGPGQPPAELTQQSHHQPPPSLPRLRLQQRPTEPQPTLPTPTLAHTQPPLGDSSHHQGAVMSYPSSEK